MLARYPEGESPGWWLQALFNLHPAEFDRRMIDNAAKVPYNAYNNYYIPAGHAVLLFVPKGTQEAQDATTALLDTNNPDWWVKGAEDTADWEGKRYYWARAKHLIDGSIGLPPSVFELTVDGIQEDLWKVVDQIPQLSDVTQGIKDGFSYAVKAVFWVLAGVGVVYFFGPALVKSGKKMISAAK